MINPRLERIETLGRITVWRVDGEQVRAHFDPEFTDFGEHYAFPKLIPEFEFWIDKGYEDEEWFFIDNMETEWKLMRAGKSYEYAHAKGVAREISVRRKVEKVPIGRTGNSHAFELQQIGEEGGLPIKLVDGDAVRYAFDDDFVEGGHDLVYKFVPPNTYWIEQEISIDERPYIILHEVTQRNLMAQGMGYLEAHKIASRSEYAARHNMKESIMDFTSQAVEDMVQSQMNRERQNAAAYESLAATLENLAWSGFAKWMRKAMHEEHAHADKFAEFLIERNVVPSYQALSAPNQYHPSILADFQQALELERANTQAIYALYERGEEALDYDLCHWLRWALEEQRKSEKELTDIVNQLERAGDDNAALLILDEKLGE